MGLHGNRFRNSFGVQRSLGDLPARSVPRKLSDWDNVRSQDGATEVLGGLASPLGANGAQAWFQPQEAGEMVLRSDAIGSLTGDLIPTRTMAVDLTGVGDLAAIGALAVAMAAALTGSGSLTATIEGRLDASVDMTGSGDLDANMVGLGNMIVAMLGAGDLDATIAAFGNMLVDIVVTGTGLTTANVGQAVLESLVENDLTLKQAVLDARKRAGLAAALSA
jgi:hypothetical protein